MSRTHLTEPQEGDRIRPGRLLLGSRAHCSSTLGRVRSRWLLNDRIKWLSSKESYAKDSDLSGVERVAKLNPVSEIPPTTKRNRRYEKYC